MRTLLAVALVALAGCSGTPAPADEDAVALTPACADPCLADALHVELTACDFAGLTVSIPADTYDLPEGYEPQRPGVGNTHPEARQIAYLMLLTCAESFVDDVATGPTSFAEVALIIEPPASGGANSEFHAFVLQHAATGPLLDALVLRGFPAVSGEVSIETTPTGRTASLAGDATLSADILQGPFMDGTGPDFTMAHYTAETWFTGYPDCKQGAFGTSAALVDPGTSVLAEAAGEAGLLRGSDTQDADCELSLKFFPAQPRA